MKGASTRAPRRRRKRSEAAVDAVPIVRLVAIRWAENDAVPIATFPSLAEADAALMHAFAREPPPPGRAYSKVGFTVMWSDEMTHEGRLDVTQEAVRRARSEGGLLRVHLEDYGRWLTSDDHRAMLAERATPAEVEERQAWGANLLARLRADARPPTRQRRARAAPLQTAGAGIPLLPVGEDAMVWHSSAPSPPTLFPTPTAACVRLRDMLAREFEKHVTDWSDPRAHAFVNYFTRALGSDLKTVRPDDAAVIWKRWRDAVASFIKNPERTGHGPMAYRSFVVAHELEQARERPGSVFTAFCPWRAAYFDPHGKGFNTVEVDAASARWEIDSWGPTR